MGLRLIIEDDDGATTIVPLEDEAVTIGRQEGNTIQLTEKNVSRRHARLWQEEGAWKIEDLESYNGIKVNGVQIQQAVTLRDGDVVQIGDYHLALASETAVVAGIARSRAANAPKEEPLLASSSAHLPTLSGEEARALRADAARSDSRRLDDDEEDDALLAGPAPTGGGRGALIAVALLLVVGGGALAWSLARPSGEAEAPRVAQQDAAPKPTPSASKLAPAPAPTAPPAPSEAAAAAPEVPAPPPPSGEETAAPEPEAGEPAPGPAGEAPAPEPAAADGASASDAPSPSPRPRKKRRAKSSPAPTPAPPPPAKTEPPAPPKDPAKLLQEARMAQIKGDAARAYRLASEANAIKPSLAARKLMGAAACKMGDAGKAKKAYAKLSGGARDDMAKLCKARGIDLP